MLEPVGSTEVSGIGTILRGPTVSLGEVRCMQGNRAGSQGMLYAVLAFESILEGKAGLRDVEMWWGHRRN